MRPLLITGNGTGVPDPFGPGFSTDVARILTDPWNNVWAQFWGGAGNIIDWQPIGYPAAMFPMRPSIDAGRAEVCRQIGLRPRGTPLFLSGYSQFAIVVGEVWVFDFLAPNGRFHDRIGDVLGIIQFGDPLRCPGIANGNLVAELPVPKRLNGQVTGGIAGKNCLTPDQTPDFLLSCALDGDLYAAAPVGADPWSHPADVGLLETMVYNLVLELGVNSVAEIAGIVADFFERPLEMVIATVQAIINGLTFAVQGPAAAHWRYEPFVQPIADWMINRAAATARAA
ncbi:hypothetical protein [Mycobacterium sp. SMC-11]|uniref:hypothetical protein n=1 Tax=Mycobacterium sp. SMC-11 TaxID=3385969 RepID=UPI00390CBFD7